MARRLRRQFKTQAPAEFKGSPAKRPISKLGGDKNPSDLQHPTGGTLGQGKLSDDPGRKEHASVAGGRLKLDPTIGSSGDNYTLGQLLYQQKLAEANQPPPLPQPSANVPQAVDPRDLGYVAPVQSPTTAPIPRTMGTPARPPNWYPETPNRIWSPDATAGTRRNTGAEDIYDTPSQLSQPQFLPPTATATNIQPPTQRPAAIPPGYGQPNVGVDITPEQFTLPPPTTYPDAEVYVPETPPVTTPIEYPTPVDVGYIEPEQPYPFTPGHQVTATERSFYNPQPVETAYAAPVNVPYVQPQETIDTATPLDPPPDEVTNLIDTIIPKTLDIPQKGPQWVEDPYGLATQELIDQSGFTQTDPSIYSPAETPTIAEAPEIQTQPTPEKLSLRREPPKFFGEGVLGGAEEQATGGIGVYGGQELEVGGETHYRSPYDDTTDQGRGWFDVLQEGYAPSPIHTFDPADSTPPVDLIGATPTTDPSRLFSPDTRLAELPITQPPEPDMPEIPAETQNLSISYPQEDPVLAGGLPEFPRGKEDYRYEVDYKRPGRGNIDEYVGGPIETDREGAREIAEILEEGTAVTPDDTTLGVTPTVEKVEKVENLETVIPAKTITLEGEVEDDDSGQTYTVDTEAEPNITQLPEAPIADTVIQGPMVGQPLKSFTPEIADPPAPITVKDKVDVEVDQGGKVDPALTTTGTGGRKWLHTGPSDFAETLHQFKINRGSSGPPIVTDTPAVSGPVVNRETGEITREPLTWHQFNPAGSSVSPYTEGISTGTETGAKGPPDVTGVSATSGAGRGGEGRTPFQTFLENQDNAGELIPGGLNLDMASLKGQAGINQLRSEMTAKDFEGIDSFEGLGNFFNLKPAFQGFGESIAGAIQELTGMEAGDLKGPGLWDTLNTPIPAFSTGEFGITPLDIITVIASGTVAIGPILMRKFMDSLMQPFETAVTDGLKGVFNTVFKRGGDAENYNKQPVSQENINTADLEVLAEELGIDKPSGMIAAGTYYGADGTVIARNMKPLDFGLNTVDGANTFKDVLHAVGTKVDPGYTSIKYNTQTGQTDVVHADGSVTENASHITIDSEGNMQQGTGKSKKTKKVNWGVKVIGVDAIDTVAPRKDKGKGKGKGGKSILDWIKDILGSGEGEDDDEDDTIKKESGN